MVFFTCNACGSSLKKNQVEKHYLSECPRCEVLSCMDCGRDFHGDEYASHTKCISEAEKYQGGLFRESGSSGKGEKKQQEWLERVQELVAKGSKVSPRIGRLLERIAQYPNIPRKKSKFENFVKNSINIRDQPTLGELWEIFSTAIKPVSLEGAEDGSLATDMSKSPCNGGEDMITVEQSSECEPVKKKKNKRRIEEESALEASEALSEESKPKSKKKKKNCKDSAIGATDATSGVGEGESVSQSPAPVEEGSVSCKLKKKKKQKQTSENVSEIDNTASNDGLAPARKKKSKREKDENMALAEKESVSVGPVEVALNYISSQQSTENGEGATEGVTVEDDCKPKKDKKKKSRSKRETLEEEKVEEPAPKKRKKHKHNS